MGPWVDERGRLFGRWNLIDLLIIAFVCALVPLAYVTYWLFRTPTPAIEAVDPPAIVTGASMRIQIRGRDLRPYFRAAIGTRLVPMVVESPQRADLDAASVEPGRYDLAIFDAATELLRLPGAITIRAAPAPPPPPLRAPIARRFELQRRERRAGLTLIVIRDAWADTCALYLPSSQPVPVPCEAR